ncbi:glycine betaine ABC transporter substrate-binding protein [Pseudomonas nicosulfuronedens]|uniref:Glycine betaine ABC transporter substrate-binding protein n=1 Tax=Pseudomonas nicosulfuronedens TaxID=2571105 RepID=A0A5R9R8P7_9PSED|nr:glycine betaine ABC transporter substrate-binding protein [Pseudomonas nicosulfuronedens]MDH1007789.1 glycine betaine ABC transporter substrate-binding protein [Pseudomonas nicosulfuronedens]MDH1977834.1 glycine betaine ABC transporter substrate-binding protein [Pseudomonas nicosulfuronedens]MDH2025567.1 glycine betaine ABC transporter substrate-binding protein [Pseudomonas nicosulfuronedens]TLX79332.1 glycine betaine ABC transporter substrate-binding protein [Pseudomonas nicosulfuronedens]
MKPLLGALGLLLAALSGGAQAADTIRIGGKPFTEQRLLTAISSQFLQSKGYDVKVTNGLGSTLARSAQESGQLDIVWEYTGSSLIVYNKVTEKLDAEQSLAKVRELDGKKGLVWPTPAPFNNTYALAMPEEQAEQLGVRTLSDLARVMKEQGDKKPHLFAMDPEFAGRPDGLAPMSELYGFHFTRDDVRQMDAGLVYTALKNRQVFVGLVYTTDGRLKDFKLRVLEDDKQYFPFYNAAPVMRADLLEKHPELKTLFDPIARLLDDKTMQALNAQVDIQQEPVQRVAQQFLREHQLIGDNAQTTRKQPAREEN